MTSFYKDDVDTVLLTSEIELLKTICKEEKPRNTAEIVAILKKYDNHLELIPNVVQILKLLLVNAATSATPERSFSTARRLKTWLRSTMSQKRFASLALLNTHKKLTDNISFIEVGNTFVSSQTRRYDYFGKFTPDDILA